MPGLPRLCRLPKLRKPNKYRQIRETQDMKTFPIGGVHPSENKLSGAKPIEVLPLPDVVTIPLAQHIGAPAVAKVAKGDKVVTGQLIAEAGSFMSANIHAPVSGTVTAGHGAQRAGAAPDDDYDQARRAMTGPRNPPLGDDRPRVYALGTGDRRPDQGRRHRRHGRRDVPHARETLDSSRKKAESLIINGVAASLTLRPTTVRCWSTVRSCSWA